MSNIKFKNFARSTLAIGAASGATSLTVAAGTGIRFPTLGAGEYFYLTLENSSLVREIVKVTARATDVLTVVRAQDNTTAQAWNAGDVAALRFNAAAIIDGFAGAIFATSATGSAIFPSGTTAQRDVAPLFGYMRANSTLNRIEWWNGSAWTPTIGAAAGANSDITSLSAITSINGGQLAGLRNKIINGNFGINKRSASGTVVLTAGQYGHDRFKAGASGCTYTFAMSANVTTLTISAGSLVQVIEGLNLFSGGVVLSWEGTAQGKIGGGSYGVSGVLGTATGGTDVSVEFGTGTLSKVQLEYGATPSAFEQRPYGLELALCQRYYQVPTVGWIGTGVSTNPFGGLVNIPQMRVTPTVAFAADLAVNGFSAASLTLGAVSPTSVQYSKVASSNAQGVYYYTTFSATAEL